VILSAPAPPMIFIVLSLEISSSSTVTPKVVFVIALKSTLVSPAATDKSPRVTV